MTELEDATGELLGAIGQHIGRSELDHALAALLPDVAREMRLDLVTMLSRTVDERRFARRVSRADLWLLASFSERWAFDEKQCLVAALGYLIYVDSLQDDRELPIVGKHLIRTCRAMERGQWFDEIGPSLLRYLGAMRPIIPQYTWLFDLARFHVTLWLACDSAHRATVGGRTYPPLAIAATMGADAGETLPREWRETMEELQERFISLVEFIERPLPPPNC